MNKTLLRACVSVGLAGLAAQAVAAPFISFDPRSMAMGGAGVAVKDFNNAPVFNPAMMARLHDDDDFNLAFPILGGRFRDQDDLIEVIDTDAEETIDELDRIARSIENSITANSIDIPLPGGGTQTVALPNSNLLVDAKDATDAVNDLLQRVDAKALDIEAGGAAVIGIPSKKFGFALSLIGWSASSGVASYADSDRQLLDDISSDAAIAAPRLLSLEQAALNNDPLLIDDAILANPTQPCIGLTNLDPNCEVNFDQDTDVDSNVRAVGIIVGEVGLTIAREFQIGSSQLAIGVTPKMVTVSTFDFLGNIDTAEVDDFSDISNDDSNFNIDLGVAHSYDNGWQVGAVVKNLISQEYEAPVQNDGSVFVVELEPQIRAGVSYQNSWLLGAFDLDLTENSGVGFGADSQFMSFGVEFNALDWAQLRFGYRSDLADSDRDPTLSAGFGLSPFGSFHFDFAFTADDFSDPSEVGAALQLALTF